MVHEWWAGQLPTTEARAEFDAAMFRTLEEWAAIAAAEQADRDAMKRQQIEELRMIGEVMG